MAPKNARVRARDHQNFGPSNPAGRTLTYTWRDPLAPARAAAYVDQFMTNLHWERIDAR
jgi:hypothetical protein